jgi:hypothetical protein
MLSELYSTTGIAAVSFHGVERWKMGAELMTHLFCRSALERNRTIGSVVDQKSRAKSEAHDHPNQRFDGEGRDNVI